MRSRLPAFRAASSAATIAALVLLAHAGLDRPALAQNAPAAQAGNAIQSVTATIAQGGNVLVRITLREAPSAAPNGFQISNPSRLSFDFPNTANGTGRSAQEVAQGDLRSVELLSATGTSVLAPVEVRAGLLIGYRAK